MFVWVHGTVGDLGLKLGNREKLSFRPGGFLVVFTLVYAGYCDMPCGEGNKRTSSIFWKAKRELL